jgi:hypothetical protein
MVGITQSDHQLRYLIFIPYCEENIEDTRFKHLKTKLSGLNPFSVVTGISLLFDNWLENEFKLPLL